MAVDNQPRSHTCSSFISFIKPQYRGLLRCSRRRPYLFRLCRNLSLIVCFATCLCAAACMYRFVDEIIEEAMKTEPSAPVFFSDRKRITKTKPSISLLKRVLEQRGVSSDHVIERREINNLIKQTGEVTEDELKFGEGSHFKSTRFQSSISPDTILHAQIVSPNQANQGAQVNSTKGAESVVFDSEAEFVELVDDNKDSVWLLSVITTTSHHDSDSSDSHSSLRTLITDEAWGHLVHRYSPFGFKMGMINCRRLRSLCYERGLIAADLILALPKGGDRIKDSVQYRAFPKQTTTRQSNSVATDIVLQQVHIWLAGVLAERIRYISNIDDIVPASFEWTTSSAAHGRFQHRWLPWLTGRPRPIHVIWLSNQTSQLQDHAHDSRRSTQFPPLALSALSVPFTGRVRFWVMDSTLQSDLLYSDAEKSVEANHWLTLSPSTTSVMELFDALGCSKNSTYLIITPEATCYAFGQHRGEFLSYPNLELHLRLLYPSVDDSVLCFFFLLNSLILFNTAIGAGKLLAFVGRRWMGMSLPHTREDLGLIQSFIRFARQGWTLHRPSRTGQQHTNYNSASIHNDMSNSSVMPTTHNRFSIKKQTTRWVKASFMEFLSCNLFFLLTILPVINALSMSYAACFLNLALWFLRSVVLLPPIISLRLSIVTGHFTWFRLGAMIMFCYFLISALAAHVYFVLLDVEPSMRRQTASLISSRRLSRASPGELLAELTRSLLASDLERHADQTASSMGATSSSSVSEQDPTEPITSELAFTSDRLSTAQSADRVRLLRRLDQLHELLHQGTNFHPSTSVAASEDVAFEMQEGDQRHIQREAPAHIYTWQCSRPMRTNEQLLGETESRSGPRNKKLHSLQYLSCDAVATYNTYPSPIPQTGSEYEAEDEDEDSVVEQISVSSRHAYSRRIRYRKPRSHMPHQLDSVSSSSEQSSKERNSSNVDPSNKFSSLMHPSVDWPPWVIPCNECVVCWRVFRHGVRLGALPCGHGFHETCIRRWLDTGALDCPVCRWPAHAPHLRQQRQMIGQLLTALESTLNTAHKRGLRNSDQ